MADRDLGSASDVVRYRTVRLGTHQIAYQEAGPRDGPLVVLLHGMASDGGTWDPVIRPLAAHGLRVVAPDLLGHGNSAKPGSAGYLLPHFAAGLRDLVQLLGSERAAVVGHSFGGAVAMQCAYEYPQLVDRLVLVAAGGLGREVHVLLRAATLPGARAVISLAAHRRTHALVRVTGVHRRMPPETMVNLARIGRSVGSAAGRSAFIATVRGVIELGGQRGSMIELERLARNQPTLLVWAARDPIIPLSHARAAHSYLTHAALEIFPGATHEPHRRYPTRFAEAVAEFVVSPPRPTVPEHLNE